MVTLYDPVSLNEEFEEFLKARNENGHFCTFDIEDGFGLFMTERMRREGLEFPEAENIIRAMKRYPEVTGENFLPGQESEYGDHTDSESVLINGRRAGSIYRYIDGGGFDTGFDLDLDVPETIFADYMTLARKVFPLWQEQDTTAPGLSTDERISAIVEHMAKVTSIFLPETARTSVSSPTSPAALREPVAEGSSGNTPELARNQTGLEIGAVAPPSLHLVR